MNLESIVPLSEDVGRVIYGRKLMWLHGSSLAAQFTKLNIPLGKDTMLTTRNT